MDRAVDAVATKQRGVGGVHDRVDVLRGDVPFQQDDPRHAAIVVGP